MANRRRSRIVLVGVAVGLAVAVGGLVLGVRGEAGQHPIVFKSTFTMREAQAFGAYPVYHAGEKVEGLEQSAILRRNDEPTDYVSFVYGYCDPFPDGCAPAAEVQTWSACSRNLSMYDSPSSPAPERTVVRGVPAAFFEGGRRLEIYTGKSTVVIFARERDEALAIAGQLRGVNVAVVAEQALPEPALGALTGLLRCR